LILTYNTNHFSVFYYFRQNEGGPVDKNYAAILKMIY